MIAHLYQILWSLRVLWSIEGVVWSPDRLRLWRKSINLYLSFLAFTDPLRPNDQLRRTMICAVLCAVYDYDSDWSQGKRDGANFRPLLEQLVESVEAKAIAAKLFKNDVSHKLQDNGLKRGSVALRFNQLVINSDWMRDYTPEEIDSFGRLLQIVDDLFDLDDDYLSGDTNCLLVPGRGQEFANEARAFLESEFFGRLKANSRVYRSIDKMTRKVLNRFGGPHVTWTQLFATGRPLTAGLYGLVLPIVSFRSFEGAPWALRLTTTLSFAGLTMSIMVFNDYIDRHHDRQKGKYFASEHPQEVLTYWTRLNLATGSALLYVGYHDIGLASFCVMVWLLGLFYSFVPHWYVAQNLIVALCCGAPALCGAVWARKFDSDHLATFSLFATLLFISEVYKDIEDARIDTGYKDTIPVRNGHVATATGLLALSFVPATIATIHPNQWVIAVASIGLPLVMFNQTFILFGRQNVARAKWAMKWLVTILLIVLLVS